MGPTNAQQTSARACRVRCFSSSSDTPSATRKVFSNSLLLTACAESRRGGGEGSKTDQVSWAVLCLVAWTIRTPSQLDVQGTGWALLALFSAGLGTAPSLDSVCSMQQRLHKERTMHGDLSPIFGQGRLHVGEVQEGALGRSARGDLCSDARDVHVSRPAISAGQCATHDLLFLSETQMTGSTWVALDVTSRLAD